MNGALRKGGFLARVQRTAGAVRKKGCCVLASSFFLGGCSSGCSAILAAARHLYKASPSDSHTTFRPEFSYLGTTFEGRGRLVGIAGLAIDWLGDKLEVVYSKQCLSRDLCLSFERWNPSVPANVASSSAGS